MSITAESKMNKQYSERLTRWLDRLNHFVKPLKYTASKEYKLPNLISPNPTENAEPQQIYEEKFVINAMAQLPTVNGRIGGNFNQSEGTVEDKTASMHDTRTQSGTRHCKTNNRHSNLTLTANEIIINNSE